VGKEELHDPHSSPNVIWVIKSRMLRLVGNVELMGEKRGTYRFCWKNVRERNYSKDLGLDDRKNLKVVLQVIGWEM
jgi:hypothetical protein